MQISYHSVLTKIQKLQNFKKKLYIYIYIYKNFFSVPANTTDTG